jgi:hypothetical protein
MPILGIDKTSEAGSQPADGLVPPTLVEFTYQTLRKTKFFLESIETIVEEHFRLSTISFQVLVS